MSGQCLDIHGERRTDRKWGAGVECMLLHVPAAFVMQDLQHAIDLFPDTDAKAECHTERGMVYQKLHDFARAVKDLKQVRSLNNAPLPPNAPAPLMNMKCTSMLFWLNVFPTAVSLLHEFTEHKACCSTVDSTACMSTYMHDNGIQKLWQVHVPKRGLCDGSVLWLGEHSQQHKAKANRVDADITVVML